MFGSIWSDFVDASTAQHGLSSALLTHNWTREWVVLVSLSRVEFPLISFLRELETNPDQTRAKGMLADR
jgi:hypothetical protein